MNVNKITIGTTGISAEIDFNNTANQEAAWQLYVEISTRISTFKLDYDADEKKALESLYKLFEETRKTLKELGRKALEVARLAILILNKIIRPFTTKWYNKITKDNCQKFREELEDLRSNLINYKKQLAKIADIEDFVD